MILRIIGITTTLVSCRLKWLYGKCRSGGGLTGEWWGEKLVGSERDVVVQYAVLGSNCFQCGLYCFSSRYHYLYPNSP